METQEIFQMSSESDMGDFMAIVPLAWKSYRRCRVLRGKFDDVANDVGSLYVVLKESYEYVQEHSLNNVREDELSQLGKGCHDVLQDLEGLLDYLESLPMGIEPLWEQESWKQTEIEDIRLRLIYNISLLMTYNTTLSSFSHARIMTIMNRSITEIREGARDSILLSSSTIDSLSSTDLEMRRETVKILCCELEAVGMSKKVFLENEELIIDRFRIAIESGELEIDYDERDHAPTPDSVDFDGMPIDLSEGLADLSLTPEARVMVSKPENSAPQILNENCLEDSMIRPQVEQKARLAQIASEALSFYLAKSLKDTGTKPWPEQPWFETVDPPHRINNQYCPIFKKSVQTQLATEAAQYVVLKRKQSTEIQATMESRPVDNSVPIFRQESATKSSGSGYLLPTKNCRSPIELSASGSYPTNPLISLAQTFIPCPRSIFRYRGLTDSALRHHCPICIVNDSQTRYLPWLDTNIARLVALPIMEPKMHFSFSKRPLFKIKRHRDLQPPQKSNQPARYPTIPGEDSVTSEMMALHVQYLVSTSGGNVESLREILDYPERLDMEVLPPFITPNEAFLRAAYKGHLEILNLIRSSRITYVQTNALQPSIMDLLSLDKETEDAIMSSYLDSKTPKPKGRSDILSWLPPSDHRCEALLLLCFLTNPYNNDLHTPRFHPEWLKDDPSNLAKALHNLVLKCPSQIPPFSIISIIAEFVCRCFIPRFWGDPNRVVQKLPSTFRSPVLCWAATNGLTDLVRVLLFQKHYEPNVTDTLHRAPLFLAAKCGRVATVRVLLSEPLIDVNMQDHHSRTPLLEAARQGEVGVVKLLLQRKDVNVNQGDDKQRSPLYWAIYGGHAITVKLLLTRCDLKMEGHWEGVQDRALFKDVNNVFLRKEEWITRKSRPATTS